METSKLEIPKTAKAKTHILPININDKDRARILKEMIQKRSKIVIEELKLSTMKDEHKTAQAIITDDINDLAEDIENKFKVGASGVEDRPISCYVRKNFSVDPPVREFIEEKNGNIVHSEQLQITEFQTKTDEWVIGETPKSKFDQKKEDNSKPSVGGNITEKLGDEVKGDNIKPDHLDPEKEDDPEQEKEEGDEAEKEEFPVKG